ncbi:hypothetical protein HHA02_09100 [Cobetia marina]|nr:hypothetical protein HHA02_09100 [Cobetia marina]
MQGVTLGIDQRGEIDGLGIGQWRGHRGSQVSHGGILTSWVWGARQLVGQALCWPESMHLRNESFQ